MKAPGHDPGRLRHRVRLEEPVETPDGAGGMAVSFAPLATVWGLVEPLSVAERTLAGHLAGLVTHRVTIRWRSDPSTAMRLIHRERVFRIRAFRDPDEDQRFLVIEAEEEEA